MMQTCSGKVGVKKTFANVAAETCFMDASVNENSVNASTNECLVRASGTMYYANAVVQRLSP